MELSLSLVNTLKVIGSESLTNEIYEDLLDQIFNSFRFNKSNHLSIDSDIQLKDTGVKNKDAFSSLFNLITEIAKIDLDTGSISSYLEDLGFSNQKIKSFVELYQAKYHLIRLYLSNITFSYPHIVDVKWRLNYSTKENTIERINEPTYLIELKTERPGEDKLDTIQFTCTLEQLQDLVYKLKEASKSIDKLNRQ